MAEDDKVKPGTGDAAGPAGSSDVEDPASLGAVVRRWRAEGFPEKAALVLRALGWLFSALAFLVMACNKHGDWRDFGKYQEYRWISESSSLIRLLVPPQIKLPALHAMALTKQWHITPSGIWWPSPSSPASTRRCRSCGRSSC